MNFLTTDPGAALTVAQQTVADRIQQSQRRALAKCARASRVRTQPLFLGADGTAASSAHRQPNVAAIFPAAD